MAYSVYADVALEFPGHTFSVSGTRILTGTLTEWISQADAYIDSRIGLIYSTPATGTESLKVLKNISIQLVAHRVDVNLQIKTPEEDLAQGGPKSRKALADKMLQDIVDRKTLLSDATLVNSAGAVSSYAESNSKTFTFTKGTDQW